MLDRPRILAAHHLPDGRRIVPSRRHGGVERGQRNVGVINLYRIAGALDMSLSELFAEVESSKEQGGG